MAHPITIIISIITGYTASALVLIAFGNASQAGDRFSDETLHRIDHGDLRLADLLNTTQPRGE